jgi:hypothetical protein
MAGGRHRVRPRSEEAAPCLLPESRIQRQKADAHTSVMYPLGILDSSHLATVTLTARYPLFPGMGVHKSLRAIVKLGYSPSPRQEDSRSALPHRTTLETL